MGLMTEMVLGFVRDVTGDIFSKFGIAITEIYVYCIEINQTPLIAAASTFTMFLGASLSAVLVIKQIIGTYGIGTEGDPDADPMELVFRLCKALGLMGANTWIFTEALKLSKALGEDVTSIFMGVYGADINSKTIYDRMMDSWNTDSIIPTWSICISACMIGMMIYGVIAALRGAEITLNRILFPIFCLDSLNANPEKWKMFTFQYLVSFFSYVLQMFCFNVYLYTFWKMGDISQTDIKTVLMLLAWLVLSIRAPSWLEKYIYATGTGRAISQGASRLGQVAMFVGMRV